MTKVGNVHHNATSNKAFVASVRCIKRLGECVRSTRSADFSRSIIGWSVAAQGVSSVVDWPCASRALQSQWVGSGAA